MKDNEKKRVDPRVLRTRQLIKDALIDLLQELELNKITVNRIAESATINRVTFYLHYHDIQDMLEKMAQEMAEDIECIMMRTTTNMNSTEEIDSLKLINLLEHIAENAKFYKVVHGSTNANLYRAVIKYPNEINNRENRDRLLARYYRYPKGYCYFVRFFSSYRHDRSLVA